MSNIRRFSCMDLTSFLSGKGVSQSGIQSVRENAITGEMLIDFCEEDIRDAFSVFKDRFIIRKVIRECSVTSQRLYSPYPTSNAQKTSIPQPQQRNIPSSTYSHSPSGNSQRQSSYNYPGHDVSQQRVPVNYRNSIAQESFPRSEKTPSKSFPSPGPSPTHMTVAHTQPYPISLIKVDSSNAREIKAEARVRSPTVSSSIEESQKHIKEETQQQKQNIPGSSDIVHVIDFTKDNKNQKTTPETSEKVDAARASNPHAPTAKLNMDLVITLDERNRLKKYSADDLLAKKSLRGRPNEAQHLGSLAIRNAAQAAQIWESAPRLKDISERHMEVFKQHVCTFAPQLATKMDVVLVRLRESLQNRRKYLLDRETGKRSAKSVRRSFAFHPFTLPNATTEKKVEGNTPETVIDLVD